MGKNTTREGKGWRGRVEIGFVDMLPFLGACGGGRVGRFRAGEIRRFLASTHPPHRHVPYLACTMQKLPLDSLFLGPVAVSV